jgi:hypothetical protein
MTITRNYTIQSLVHLNFLIFQCWIVWVASSKLCVLEFVGKSYFHDKWLSLKIVHAKLVTRILSLKECLGWLQEFILIDIYLLFMFLCLAIGVFHIIQTKTFRCSYHVNKVSNFETMVYEKVERMEYVHLSIPYETKWIQVWTEHFASRETCPW